LDVCPGNVVDIRYGNGRDGIENRNEIPIYVLEVVIRANIVNGKNGFAFMKLEYLLRKKFQELDG
jgi:hypothetical protein